MAGCGSVTERRFDLLISGNVDSSRVVLKSVRSGQTGTHQVSSDVNGLGTG